MSYQGKTEQISPHFYSCDANGGIVDAHIPRWKAEEIAAEADARIAALEAENAKLREVLKYARRMVKPSECDTTYIDAALAQQPQ